MPGYLADLCPRSRNLLDEWILTELHKLRTVLGIVAEAMGMSIDEAVRTATRLLRGEPPRTPRELRLGEKIVEENIAYPCLTGVEKRSSTTTPVHCGAGERI